MQLVAKKIAIQENIPVATVLPAFLVPRGSAQPPLWFRGGGGVLVNPSCRQTLLEADPPSEADPHSVNRMTDTCKNISLPQTSFAGGKNRLMPPGIGVLYPPLCVTVWPLGPIDAVHHFIGASWSPIFSWILGFVLIVTNFSGCRHTHHCERATMWISSLIYFNLI